MQTRQLAHRLARVLCRIGEAREIPAEPVEVARGAVLCLERLLRIAPLHRFRRPVGVVGEGPREIGPRQRGRLLRQRLDPLLERSLALRHLGELFGVVLPLGLLAGAGEVALVVGEGFRAFGEDRLQGVFQRRFFLRQPIQFAGQLGLRFGDLFGVFLRLRRLGAVGQLLLATRQVFDTLLGLGLILRRLGWSGFLLGQGPNRDPPALAHGLDAVFPRDDEAIRPGVRRPEAPRRRPPLVGESQRDRLRRLSLRRPLEDGGRRGPVEGEVEGDLASGNCGDIHHASQSLRLGERGGLDRGRHDDCGAVRRKVGRRDGGERVPHRNAIPRLDAVSARSDDREGEAVGGRIVFTGDEIQACPIEDEGAKSGQRDGRIARHEGDTHGQRPAARRDDIARMDDEGEIRRGTPRDEEPRDESAVFRRRERRREESQGHDDACRDAESSCGPRRDGGVEIQRPCPLLGFAQEPGDEARRGRLCRGEFDAARQAFLEFGILPLDDSRQVGGV